MKSSCVCGSMARYNDGLLSGISAVHCNFLRRTLGQRRSGLIRLGSSIKAINVYYGYRYRYRIRC